jgi:hypothetical protein
MFSYGYLVGAGQVVSGRHVDVSEKRFHELLHAMLTMIEVDEEWYRQKNPDVVAAIKVGEFQSGRHHYISSGYFEDRFPYNIIVSNDWYLSQYADVAAAVQGGLFSSAQEHFVSNGFREGRLPYPNWSLLKSGRILETA